MNINGWVEISPINSKQNNYRAILNKRNVSVTLSRNGNSFLLIMNIKPYRFKLMASSLNLAKKEAEDILSNKIGDIIIDE